ncbi:toll/interleukin-1 receptor domain-containing protein [Streptomyces sp. NA04227]|uniref:toll/interleukin-1 receptor domain-containing protein n=1 Tax=Streptomyces sp. NA04227 TaxID=2742136 RepID=UPI001590AA74|nr:toll/interleukin-1 receptor domain-containing protein [Streptomyces sp. NA04227]QKW05473.1 toll/interleukin-1 receptor domain-containing protein [Streptomyces sp. NA04227]
MPEIFINYRTGDGEHVATILFQELTHRFGEDAAFRASDSIRLGQNYSSELVRGVRRASAFLVVVGPNWASAPQLHDKNDWVRKEILEALSCEVPIVPVLASRTIERLRPDQLPQPLRRIANLQSARYDTQDREGSLTKLVDELLFLVPSLAEKAKNKAQPGQGPAESPRNVISGGSQGSTFQSGEISGDVYSTSIDRAHGPVHTGKGNQNFHTHQAGSHVSHGNGATHFSGDNNGQVQNSHADARLELDEGGE